jgi:hypothetical protein
MKEDISGIKVETREPGKYLSGKIKVIFILKDKYKEKSVTISKLKTITMFKNALICVYDDFEKLGLTVDNHIAIAEKALTETKKAADLLKD